VRSEPSVFKLRVLLAALVVAYGFTQYLQWWYAPFLSVETKEYQRNIFEVLSGPDLRFGLQKLCWLLGNFVGALGIALMFFRIRSGVFMLLACPSLLIAAIIFGAPEPAFPDIELTIAKLLWCLTAAIWGSVVTYALVESRILFSKQTRVVVNSESIEKGSAHPVD
jgi:predicted cobalt transporter CbtA